MEYYMELLGDHLQLHLGRDSSEYTRSERGNLESILDKSEDILSGGNRSRMDGYVGNSPTDQGEGDQR